jgi:hypothetical protein
MTRRRGQFADLRYPVTPMLARMLARAVDGQIFDHRETVMGLRRLARAVCESVGSAMARRRRQFADLGYPVTKMLACTHVGAGGR